MSGLRAVHPTESARDGGRGRRPSRPRRRVPPRPAGSPLRDPRRKRADRRLLAQAWDSLRLFTPARYNALPGMAFPGPAHSFSTKDEVADYLEAYAARFELPVRTGVRVDRLSRNGSRFVVEAGDRVFEAENVVVAMASHRSPGCLRSRTSSTRASSSSIPASTGTLRSSRKGPVLVVGVRELGRRDRDRGGQRAPDLARGKGERSCPLPDRERDCTIRLPAADVPVHRPPRADGAHADRAQDAPEAPLPRRAARPREAQRHRRRRHRTRSSRRRRAGRIAAARGRPRPRGGERHLVHGIQARLLLDRPPRLRRGG